MPAISIAREDVVSVLPDASATDVSKRLRDAGVGCVVVVERDRPVGIVTDRDVAIDVVGAGADPDETTASDLMARELVTAHRDAGLYELVERMAAEKVRRMPLLDDHEQLAGIVTFDDLLVLLGDELDGLTDVVEAESPPY